MNRIWIWVSLVGGSVLLAFLAAFLLVIGQNPHQPAGGLLVYGP